MSEYEKWKEEYIEQKSEQASYKNQKIEEYQEIAKNIENIEHLDYSGHEQADSLVSYLEELVKLSQVPLPDNLQNSLYKKCIDNKWLSVAEKIKGINE